MNRREFLGTGLAAGIYSAGSEKLFALSGHNSSYESREARSTPAWLADEPIVTAGCWDEFPLFQRRLGGGPAWSEEIYKEQGSEEIVRQLKDIGITLAIIHFFKGFGLVAEREHIADARALAKLLKQNGIRVGLYVGSTIAYETFLLEKPEAETWFAPDYLGKPVTYDDQTFRKRVYFMHPGYLEYMRQVVRLGIETLHADLIHFDNCSYQARHAVFQHPLAVQDFRQYLSAKYSMQELKRRFGFSDLRYVIPPQPDMSRAFKTIDDPLFQEWTDFRCHQLGSYYAGISSFIHSINPEVAIDNNPSSGMAGRNTIWEQGVDFPTLFRSVDIICTEEGTNAGVSSIGILVSKIRTFKMATLMNKRVFCYSYGSLGAWGYQQRDGGPLQMAESMAYNRQCLGMVGGFHDVPELPLEERKYVQFFRDNFQFFRNPKSVADVAFLYSYSTMGFNNGRPAESFMLASQMLIQNRFLFDIIFDEHLHDLSKYRVLFLADQECLSDREIELVRNFVSQGGGLIATGQTSLYTGWRRRRKDFGLRECFGISAPKWNGPDLPEATISGAPRRTNFGKGKVVYIPEVIPATRRSVGEDMSSKYWTPAVNHGSLRDAVLWAMGDSPTLQVEKTLSPYVTMELIHQEIENSLILHVLNYGHSRDPFIRDIKVELTIPMQHKVKTVRMLTPGQQDGERTLEWSGGQRVRFIIPKVEVYTIAILDLE